MLINFFPLPAFQSRTTTVHMNSDCRYINGVEIGECSNTISTTTITATAATNPSCDIFKRKRKLFYQMKGFYCNSKLLPTGEKLDGDILWWYSW